MNAANHAPVLGFNSSETENTESVINLEQRSWSLLRRKIDEELADAMILMKLRNRFEEKFRYDEKGLPRVWKPEDDIDSYFSKAKEEVLFTAALWPFAGPFRVKSQGRS